MRRLISVFMFVYSELAYFTLEMGQTVRLYLYKVEKHTFQHLQIPLINTLYLGSVPTQTRNVVMW